LAAWGAINDARRALLAAMKANAPLVALVPAARIYPPRVPTSPTWPYIRHGVGIATPIKGACVNGASVVAAISVFAKGGDEMVGAIADAVVALFDGPDGNGLSTRTPLGKHAVTVVESVNIFQDGSEADNWRAVLNTRTTVTGGPD
jgi:hypothetical protein